MADFSALKQSIQNYIKQNGNKEITGAILQNILLSMVTTMGDGAINGNASDISDIKGDVQNINGDITDINGAITNINGDITDLNGGLSDEKNRAEGAETTTLLFSDGKLVFKNAVGTVLYQLSVDSFLSAITTRLNTGALYAGYATPSTTPATLTSQEVFYIATQAGTYTNFHFNGGDDPIVLTKDGIYFIVSGNDDDDWNAEPMLQLDDVPTAGSDNPVKSGGVAEELALGAVYDVSAKNPTAGHNNDGKWESLSALLSDANLNTLIPTSVRKGGMSVKFVSSVDNKYVQYRLVSDSFNTTPSNWQKSGAEVSVSQNTQTGHTEIHIGNNDYPVASVEEVSQLGQLLNEGYQFRNVAVLTPNQTNPGNLDQNMFFLASEPGIYSNFGNLVVGDDELAVLIYTKSSNSWTKKDALNGRNKLLNEGYQFRNVAVLTPNQTNPGNLDQNIFFLAHEAGTYTNFGNLVVEDGEIAALIYTKSSNLWVKKTIAHIPDDYNELFNRQIAGVIPQSHNWSPYGSGYSLSVDSSTQEVTYGLTSSNNSGVTYASSTNAKPYAIRMKAYSTINGQKMVVGFFASEDVEDKKIIELSTTPQEYFLHFTGKYNGIAYSPGFGVFGADKNIGAEIHITLFNVSEDGDIATRVAENTEKIAEIVGFTDYPFTNNIDSVFQSINKKDKYLTKICLFGDSLLANDIGGDIPSDVDEGNTKRPMRLLTNNVARRLYDWMSWNKPIWRRFDNADWTKSGFASFTPENFFFGTQEQYCRATTSGAYMEITIPQGYEHFALIANKKTGMGVLNVAINGNLPSTIKYTNPVLMGNPRKSQQELETLIENNSVVNSSVVPLQLPCGNNSINLAADAGNVGNPYEIYEFHNLPSGQANTIRFTTASATECDIWGGFYWSGNTMVIMDIAIGGHTSTQLLQYATDQLYNVQYDALMWEFPEMNDLQLTLAQSEANFRSMISSLRVKGIDFVFTSCNPLGLSIVHDTNFYAKYTSPTQEDINDKIRSVANKLRVPFIDIFKYFEWNIVNKGGSLAGGEGGLWFTWDGQHGNPNGVRLWFEALKKVFEKSPITISD